MEDEDDDKHTEVKSEDQTDPDLNSLHQEFIPEVGVTLDKSGLLERNDSNSSELQDQQGLRPELADLQRTDDMNMCPCFPFFSIGFKRSFSLADGG